MDADLNHALRSIDTKLTQIHAQLKRVADALEKMAGGAPPKP
jgi:hypothetical protein